MDGAANRKGKIVNPIAAFYYGAGEAEFYRKQAIHSKIIHPIQSLQRCPSLPVGEAGVANTATSGSKGTFDYSFPQAFSGRFIAKLEINAQWKGNDMPTSLIVEEDPRWNSGFGKYYKETSWGNGDTLGEWHDYGLKGGYTAIDGHSTIVRSVTVKQSVIFD